MFDETEKYSQNDHFFLRPDSVFSEVCNAPKKGIGIYIVYALVNGQVILKCIKACGTANTKDQEENGLFNQIINSTYQTKPHRWIWPEIMKEEDIVALDIYWYVTVDEMFQDDPLAVKAELLNRYINVHGALPPWNE
jgi:hypothetical protein